MSNAVNIYKSEKGLTLVELLLVITLLTISIGVTSDILLSLVRSFNKGQVLNEVEQDVNFISQKLTKELRNSLAVSKIGDDTTPAQGEFSNKVSFTKNDATYTEITYEVDTVDHKIYRKVGAATRQLLIPNTTYGIEATCASNQCFKILQDSPQVLQISISFSQGVTSGTPLFQGNIKIDDTIVIRNTY